jgi:rhodanese-related sulfurtransferase
MSHQQFAYAGDIEPIDTYAALRMNPAAVLVDVRSRHEWESIGVPELPDLPGEPLFIEWHHSDGAANPAFITELADAVSDRDVPLFFLCRSGQRSRSAAIAATAIGFSSSFNVSNGFEGPPDSAGRRGTTSGWQSDQLPWKARA